MAERQKPYTLYNLNTFFTEDFFASQKVVEVKGYGYAAFVNSRVKPCFYNLSPIYSDNKPILLLFYGLR